MVARRLRQGFAALLALPLVAAALASLGVASKPVAVDLRAFGDAAYVGGLSAFAEAPKGWVKAHLAKLAPLRSKDVNFLNLEGSLTRSCRAFAAKTFPFAIAPGTLAQFGKQGFNLIGLANNHALDCLDPVPGAETTKALAAARKAVPSLAAHGVAGSLAALLKPAVLTVKGVRIGFVALKAWDAGYGAGIGNWDNRKDVMRALRDANVDVRVLSLHGGVESTRRPSQDVLKIAREFVSKYGGDVVFAHHPHRAQGFEVLERKKDGRVAVVFYSLGNFLHNGLSAAGDGLAAKVEVTKDGVVPASLAAFPLAGSSTDPGPASAARAKAMGSILRSSSAWIGTRPLPAGLTRLPFTLVPLEAPARGFKLDLRLRSAPKILRAQLRS